MATRVGCGGRRGNDTRGLWDDPTTGWDIADTDNSSVSDDRCCEAWRRR